MSAIQKIKHQVKSEFKKLAPLYCPILSEEVSFTSEGFMHLIYESNRAPRKISEQYLKLKCFTHVPYVIAHCRQVSDTRVVRRKIKGKWKETVRYQLVCETESGVEIRVILEKIGNGKLHFLSVMPHKKRSRTKTKKRPDGRS